MITPIDDAFLEVVKQFQLLQKAGFNFDGDLENLRRSLDQLHYTVRYLQFVEDHCRDSKTLANFLGVPNDPAVIGPARKVFEDLRENHSQSCINAAMAELRRIRENYFKSSSSRSPSRCVYKNVAPTLAQRLAA